MGNDLNSFEKLIKESLENHEVPYDASHWDEMNQSLDSLAKPSTFSTSTLYAALIAAGIIVSGVFIYQSIDSESTLTANELVYHEDTTDQPFNVKPSNANETAPAVVQHDGNNEANNAEEAAEEGANDNAEIIVDNVNDNNKTNNTEAEEPVHNNTPQVTNNEEPNHQPQQTPHAVNAVKPTLVFNSDVMEGCGGVKVRFFANSNEIKGNYLWNFGDGTYSKEVSPVHTYTEADNGYDVSLTVQGNDGEVYTRTIEDMITVYERPEADFDWEFSENNIIPMVEFQNKANAIEWKWNFNDGHKSFSKAPTHLFRKKGIYNVELIVSNIYNCYDTIVKPVRINNDLNLLAATGFTPNGDGLNDDFLPEALKVMDVNFQMNIYNKDGQLIYDTNEKSRPWDGRVLGTGNMAVPGTYVWVVVIKDNFGFQDTHKGTITLLE